MNRVSARRALEALRSGVPSREAVAALGTGQGVIEDTFLGLLGRVGLPPVNRASADASRGLLLGADFGAGKSHLLEHLAALAEGERMVVSRVVISKETPLHDPGKVFRAAVDTAAVAEEFADVVNEAAMGMDPGGAGYLELLRWTTGADLDERFAATVALLPQMIDADGEFAEAIVRFWAGDPLSVVEVRRRLRAAGEARRTLRTAPARELARQRFRFLGRVFAAAGYAGWVLLFDEVELIGRYSLLQRGRAYAEIAQWLRPDPDDPGSPLVPVLAMTSDFAAAVLTMKNDRELVPVKMRAKQRPEWDELAGAAEAGVRLIERQMHLLEPPDDAELDAAYARLKALHGEAFGWGPPDVGGLERLGATRMRQYVRAWINEWDLVRLYPEYEPDLEVLGVATDYREDPDLDSGEAADG
ncbi:MAG: BREX system ATP-binding domain-containing protein [Frankiaceae bacterium]